MPTQQLHPLVVYLAYILCLYPTTICNSFVVMNKNANIKRRIYEQRRIKGYSQEYMADRLDISLNSYRKIEKGDTNLVSSRLDDIADILEVPCDDLIFDMENTRAEYSLNHLRKIEELTKKIEAKDKYIAYLEQLIALQREKLESYSKPKP